MMNIGPIVGLLLVGGACDDVDPKKGGFFSGLSGLSQGCYEQRIDEREEGVDQREEKRDALEAERQDLEARSSEAAAELDRLRSEHLALKRRIVKLNSDLAARRVELDGDTRSRMQSALTAQPGSGSDADRIASLRAAIDDAKALVTKLSSL